MGLFVAEEKLTDPALRALADRYLEKYKTFDKAHGPDHVEHVRKIALQLAKRYLPNKLELVELAAILHDVGLTVDRKDHEKHGVTILLNDPELRKLLAEEDYLELTHAVGEHRASTGEPKTTLAKIVADADRTPLSTKSVMLRAINYAAQDPKLPYDELVARAADHQVWKYTVVPKTFVAMSENWDNEGDPRGYGRESTNFPETQKLIDAVYAPIVKAWQQRDLKRLKSLARVYSLEQLRTLAG